MCEQHIFFFYLRNRTRGQKWSDGTFWDRKIWSPSSEWLLWSLVWRISLSPQTQVFLWCYPYSPVKRIVRGQLKCDGTRAETRFRLSAKRPSPFKSAGASVQSTTGSRGVRISDSNAGCTMFRGRVKGWLPTPFASFPFSSPPVRHRVPSHFSRSIPLYLRWNKTWISWS